MSETRYCHLDLAHLDAPKLKHGSLCELHAGKAACQRARQYRNPYQSSTNIETLFIAAFVLAFWIFWNRDGWVRVGRKLGLFQAPPEGLQRIVEETAAKMNVQFNELSLMRVSLAQAAAIPASRRLLFSERLLQLLSDDEIAAVCAHELAHLTEARIDYYKRYVIWLIFLPWLFVKPMVYQFGLAGFLLLALATVSGPLLYRRVSRKLETRADHIAQSHQAESGIYARAGATLRR